MDQRPPDQRLQDPVGLSLSRHCLQDSRRVPGLKPARWLKSGKPEKVVPDAPARRPVVPASGRRTVPVGRVSIRRAESPNRKQNPEILIAPVIHSEKAASGRKRRAWHAQGNTLVTSPEKSGHFQGNGDSAKGGFCTAVAVPGRRNPGAIGPCGQQLPRGARKDIPKPPIFLPATGRPGTGPVPGSRRSARRSRGSCTRRGGTPRPSRRSPRNNCVDLHHEVGQRCRR